MSHGDTSRAVRRLPETGAGIAIVLGVLFTASAIMEAGKLNSLRSTEVWGHLRAGAWILENHGVPRAGLFSQSANQAWRDFSWGFDAVVAGAYKIFGLRAVPGLAMGFRVSLAVVLFLLAGGRRGNVWGAGLLSVVGLYTLSGIELGSTTASVVLFGAELMILFEWRRSAARFRPQLILPLLILVWANIDVGVVYGIAVLVLYVVSLYVQPTAGRPVTGINTGGLARTALAVLLGCVAVSGMTPYGYTNYPAFWQVETSAANGTIPGYPAMGFRQPLDYIVLSLAMSAFLAMGLRRSRDVFLLTVLSGSTMLAFHSQRESWLVIVSAVAVIGCIMTESAANEGVKVNRLSWRRLMAIVGTSALVTALVFFVSIPRDFKTLMARVGETLPVKACDFIRGTGLAQPLFNAYRWGAFVTWYLPEYPVAIDSRRGLYSEEMESGYFKVMKAEAPYQSLPLMRDARTLLLERSSVMAEALKNVKGFQVAYEDDIATVFSQDAQP